MKIYTKYALAIGIALFLSHSSNGQLMINTIAGNGIAGSSGDGGVATAAALNGPNGACVDAIGNVFVTDADNNKIRKIDRYGVITTIAGIGSPGFSGDGGPASAAQLNHPSGIAVDYWGNLYVGDIYNHRIRKVDTAGIITTVAGRGTSGYSGDGGSPLAASFNRPYGLAMSGANILYVADQYNHAIRKIDFSTNSISTIAGRGVLGYSGDNGPATAARLHYPNYVLVDEVGNVFFTDNGNHRVRKISTGNIITTYIGNGVASFGGDGGQATAASLTYPAGICIDLTGNLCVADYGNHRIRKVNSGGIISTVAGTGVSGFSGDGGLATAAELDLPIGLCADPKGGMYIADLRNQRMRRLIENTAPSFVGGSRQVISVLQNSVSNSLDSTLQFFDMDLAQAETINVSSPAVNGLVVASFSAASTGAVLLPSGSTYTPSVGYFGLDSFQVTVNDGYISSVTNVVVNVISIAGDINNTTINGLKESDVFYQIYPNPVHNIFSITPASHSEIEILSIEGRKQDFVTNASQIDVSSIPQGVYFLKIHNANGNGHQTIIFQKVD